MNRKVYFFLNYILIFLYIMIKYICSAGIVQRLECGLAKAKMSVRFRLLAPKDKIVAPSDVND